MRQASMTVGYNVAVLSNVEELAGAPLTRNAGFALCLPLLVIRTDWTQSRMPK